MTDLDAVLARVDRGIAGFDDAMWLWEHVAELRARIAELETESDRLRGSEMAKRDHLDAWDRWERAWVLGGDAEWPGHPGTVDPRDTLDALERLALGLPVEEDEGESLPTYAELRAHVAEPELQAIIDAKQLADQAEDYRELSAECDRWKARSEQVHVCPRCDVRMWLEGETP